jgi:hypothetical protein
MKGGQYAYISAKSFASSFFIRKLIPIPATFPISGSAAIIYGVLANLGIKCNFRSNTTAK